ncbi:uncharacterized protein LOC121529559 [Cheilinus undulatus]|uniref:uncharacterized protein LOC121529559 n=1 Tax=Cheilinus undulatus TaxID=241271 RepID=UPI001BD3BE62|nr:uncharacterized protein LOC121529559 [Cheilinus undulatus]
MSAARLDGPLFSYRKELKKALWDYTADTLTDINTVRKFCGSVSKWMLGRESELVTLIDIKERADDIDLNFKHVTQSENKGEAFKKFVKSKKKVDSRREELKKELSAVLKDTLVELENLHHFLDAVEKLAATSLHVFMEDRQVVLPLPEGVSLEDVQDVIVAARRICPLLLEFKRDEEAFFLPKLQNVEVLAYQLDRYIQTTQKICAMLKKRSVSHFTLKIPPYLSGSVDAGLSEDNTQRMLDHIDQLKEIRMNQNFRLVFLFDDEVCSVFLNEFSDRKPRLLQSLEELEEVAVKLDSMNKRAKISSVAGSSVGAVGGILSIVGLALSPVTAGVSLGLTMAGVGLGITSGVNGAVTTATEIGVNSSQQKKAGEVFQRIMKDMQSLQDYLEEAKIETSHLDVAVGVGRVLCKAGAIAKGIDSLVYAASAFKVLGQEGKAVVTASRVASDVPDIGKAAAKGPLILSNATRAGLIGLNAVFLGMDVFFICKDGISLAKGSETELSKIIRARAELWRSEIDAWEKMHDSLNDGLLKSEKNKAILETPFYPEM